MSASGSGSGIIGIDVQQAPVNGMVLIQRQLITTARSPVIFNNIPQNFTHLRLVAMGRNSDAVTSAEIYGRINNLAGTNYEYQQLYGTGVAAAASDGSAGLGSLVTGRFSGTSTASGYASGFITDFPCYTNTVYYKCAITSMICGFTGTAASNFGSVRTAICKTTSPVYMLTLFASGNFVVGSQFDLYGIY